MTKLFVVNWLVWKKKIIQLLPKFFMFLGWIGIMGGHLFQIAITPIRAGYMGIPDIRGAMLVSILGKVLTESFSKIMRPNKKVCTHFQWQFYEFGSSVVLWNPTNWLNLTENNSSNFELPSIRKHCKFNYPLLNWYDENWIDIEKEKYFTLDIKVNLY